MVVWSSGGYQGPGSSGRWCRVQGEAREFGPPCTCASRGGSSPFECEVGAVGDEVHFCLVNSGTPVHCSPLQPLAHVASTPGTP